MLKKRILPAVLIVAVTVGCILLSRPSRLLFLAASALAGVWETHSILTKGGERCSAWEPYGFLLLCAGFCWFGVELSWLAALFAAACFAALLHGILAPDFGGRGAMTTLSVLCYPALPFAILLRLGAESAWLPALSMGILSSWVCDSAALIFGRAFGRRKLAPRVSPNKTVLGCVAGAVSSIAAGVALFYLLRASWNIPMGLCILACVVGSSFGQVGDLAASLVKRSVGAKDFSELIPEHGGVMDKFDSALFSVPAAWLCLKLAGIV